MKPGAGVLSHPISPTLQLAGPTCGPVCSRVEPNPLHEPLKMIPWDSCSSSLGVLLPAPATNKGLCVDNTEQTANKPEAQREPPPYVVGYNGNSRYCGCVYVCVGMCLLYAMVMPTFQTVRPSAHTGRGLLQHKSFITRRYFPATEMIAKRLRGGFSNSFFFFLNFVR